METYGITREMVRDAVLHLNENLGNYLPEHLTAHPLKRITYTSYNNRACVFLGLQIPGCTTVIRNMEDDVLVDDVMPVVKNTLFKMKDYLEKRNILYNLYMSDTALAQMNLNSDTNMKREAAERALGKSNYMDDSEYQRDIRIRRRYSN